MTTNTFEARLVAASQKQPLALVGIGAVLGFVLMLGVTTTGSLIGKALAARTPLPPISQEVLRQPEVMHRALQTIAADVQRLHERVSVLTGVPATPVGGREE